MFSKILLVFLISTTSVFSYADYPLPPYTEVEVSPDIYLSCERIDHDFVSQVKNLKVEENDREVVVRFDFYHFSCESQKAYNRILGDSWITINQRGYLPRIYKSQKAQDLVEFEFHIDKRSIFKRRNTKMFKMEIAPAREVNRHFFYPWTMKLTHNDHSNTTTVEINP